ncbi:unnamed protein product, partial [Ixodes pacificus]
IDAILKSIAKNVAYDPKLIQDGDVFASVGLPRFLPLFERCVIIKHYWNSPFKTPHFIQHSIRNSERFIIPRIYTNYGKSIRSFYVPDIFNKLPDVFNQLDSLRSLKQQLKEMC